MKKTILLSLITFLSILGYSQDYSIEAKEYFSKALDKKSQIELMINSFPNMDECKLVFKDNSAYTFFGYVNDQKTAIDIDSSNNETYVDCRIEYFTTNDIVQGNDNYVVSMKNIVNQIQPNVTFYKVTYLREKGAEHGVSYKYFVNIKGKWVFFPKPYRVLR